MAQLQQRGTAGFLLFCVLTSAFWQGGVAQLGERLLCKQEVIGSIPFTSTKRSSLHPVDGWCQRFGADGGRSEEPVSGRVAATGLSRRRVRCCVLIDGVKRELRSDRGGPPGRRAVMRHAQACVMHCGVPVFGRSGKCLHGCRRRRRRPGLAAAACLLCAVSHGPWP
jgi:hypothetical protein